MVGGVRMLASIRSLGGVVASASAKPPYPAPSLAHREGELRMLEGEARAPTTTPASDSNQGAGAFAPLGTKACRGERTWWLHLRIASSCPTTRCWGAALAAPIAREPPSPAEEPPKAAPPPQIFCFARGEACASDSQIKLGSCLQASQGKR